MKEKKRIFLLIVVLTCLIIQILYFNPFTVKGAIRWSVLLQGFVMKSYFIDLEVVPQSEIGEIGDLSQNDLTLEQTVYQIVSPSLRNNINGIEMRYWIVTKKNGLYHAEFSGY